MRHLFSLFSVSITAGLLAAMLFLLFQPQFLSQAPTIEFNQVDSATLVSPPVLNGPVSYASAVSLAEPAVVNVYTAKIVEQGNNILFNDPLFRQFFGNQLKSRKQLETSLGSGVIVSSQGYILTNHHVVKQADEIQVSLADGQNVFAKIVGVDPEVDLAVLKINVANLPSITFGNSDQVKVGDIALAIGNPFGVGQTVTMGIISATGRRDLGINTFENFIQTDAAINPGNSGGALINALGELIGINTAIFSKSGGSQGIGFAIPIDIAKDVMIQIIRYGHVRRGWLGVETRNISKKLIQLYQLRVDKGVLISGVLRNGPADKAGIEPGDVITKIDGQVVENSKTLIDLIAFKPPNTKLRIEGVRGKKRFKVTIVTGERPVIK